MYYYKILFLQYIRSPYTYLSFALPFVLLLGFGWMIPSGIIIPSVITAGILAIVLLLFGASLLEFRRTSMIKSVSMTKISKGKFLLANILVSLFFCFTIFIFFMFLAWFLTSVISFLAVDYTFFTDTEVNPYVGLVTFSINWTSIRWLTFLYAFFFTVTLAYLLAFLFISFSKSSTFYYLISFMYIFAFMIMTDAFIPDFFSQANKFREYGVYIIPHTYTNNLMSLSIVVNNDVLTEFQARLAEQIPGDQIEIMNNIANPQYWDWDGLQSDLDLFNKHFDDGGTIHNLDNENFETNFFIFLNSPVGGVEHGPSYFVIMFSYPQFPPSASPYFTPEEFSKYMQEVINQKEFIIYVTDITPLWDFKNIESMLNSFVPPALSVLLLSVTTKRFTWSVR